MVQFSADPTTRGPLVEIEQSAKPLAVPHAAGPVGGWRARDESIGETVMIPLAPPMIVVDELRDQVPQVPLAERNDAIETLLLDRPDESHGVTHGVTSGVRRAFRRQDHADASLARHAPASKGAPVFGAGSIAKATWGIPGLPCVPLTVASRCKRLSLIQRGIASGSACMSSIRMPWHRSYAV